VGKAPRLHGQNPSPTRDIDVWGTHTTIQGKEIRERYSAWWKDCVCLAG